jgi:cyclophilin family peptidyl-prolyl cis-trans isomerase
VVPAFVVQGGCPDDTGWGGPGYTIRSEFNGLAYEPGTLGMARSAVDTEGSQWFITHDRQPHLTAHYTAFGRVTEGMHVVHGIQRGDRILGITLEHLPTLSEPPDDPE